MSNQNEANILYGGPEPQSIGVNFESLGELLMKKLSVNGDDLMYVDGLNNIKQTRFEIRQQVIQLAKSLSKIFDVKEGDVLGICCENRMEYAVIVLAAFCLGACVAPLNVTYTDREFDHAIKLSQPKLIFASMTVAPRALKILRSNSFIKNVIFMETNARQTGKKLKTKFTISYSELISSIPIEDCHDFNCKPIDMKNNIATVLCSSGTTGLPKGVELTQWNLVTVLGQIITAVGRAEGMVGRTRALLVLPCFHVYGLLVFTLMPLCGAEMIFLPKFEEHVFLSAIQKYKPNITFLVPPLVIFLAKSPLVNNYDLSSLRLMRCGAAPLSAEISDAVKKRLNLLALHEGYGMTETTLSVLSQNDDFQKFGSVGALQPGVWGKIVDPETGKTLGPNQRGEMCFKGNLIMHGYRNNVESTRQTIDTDGWLHTGDIGYYDDNHEWFIVDRLKELIKYKGFQVPPAEIEAQLLTHPDIIDAAVIGIPDENAGELPFAFVVRKPNSNLSVKEVIDFIAQNASPAKRLHGGVEFVDSIPKSPAGKILRRILRDHAAKKTKSKL